MFYSEYYGKIKKNSYQMIHVRGSYGYIWINVHQIVQKYIIA